MEIIYSLTTCDLGYLLVATNTKGICAVKLGDRPEELATSLRKEFSLATINHNDNGHQDWQQQINRIIVGAQVKPDIPLDLCGTEFRKQVWRVLQDIPHGQTRTYREIAQILGKPKATRAVGSACGANTIALLIPCHRVIRSDGSLGGYRWGLERKRKLLEQEAKSRTRTTN